jgi:hypothetical protein
MSETVRIVAYTRLPDIYEYVNITAPEREPVESLPLVRITSSQEQAVEAEPVRTLTSTDLRNARDQSRAKEVLNLLWRLEATRCDPQRVLDRLLDVENTDRLPKVRAALAYARQLQAALDKAGISEKKPVLAIVPLAE